MPAVSQILPPPELTEEVCAFAAKNGISENVPTVAEMARRVFPHARMRIVIQEDPLMPWDDRLIFEVDETGLEEEELFRMIQQWSSEIFQVCPATHVHFFTHVGYLWE